jgi:Kef-type K+ transport system membrane component KefB
VGLGMLPRGEVGLLFASVGRSIGALTDAEFSALVLVAVLTTLVSPVLLARALQTQ